MIDDSNPNRKQAYVFCLDRDTEAVLRESMPTSIDSAYFTGGLKSAVEKMKTQTSPDIMIIDISDSESDNSTTTLLDTLADLVEPNIMILAIGTITKNDVDFYRTITKQMGVSEIIWKPLSRAIVSTYFLPLLSKEKGSIEISRGGRVVAVCGANGGVGTSTIAASLARFIGNEARRYTIIVDANMCFPSIGYYMGTKKTKGGLKAILSNPERIDEMVIDRNKTEITDRLHMIDADESFGSGFNTPQGSAERFIEILRKKYNFIIIDLPLFAMQPHEDFLKSVNHKVVVVDPTLLSIRGAHKILKTEAGPSEPQRPTVILNKSGMKGGLTKETVSGIGKLKYDIEIPDFGAPGIHMANHGQSFDDIKGYPQIMENLAKEIGVTDLNVSKTKQSVGLSALFSGLKR